MHNHHKSLDSKIVWPDPKNMKNHVLKRDAEGAIIPTEAMKNQRRRQFLNFLNDFFEKIENGQLKNLQPELLKFTDAEKKDWVRKYFKKYYMENAVLRDETFRLKVDTDLARKKRTCSCTVGQINAKTGKLVPPNKLHGHKDKYITVKMQPNLVTQDMIDA